MNRRALHFYEFGAFRLNVTERLLYRGPELVSLTPKVFDLLHVLVENTGHVLEKSSLMEQLWPDSFVEESSLTQNISLLRRALGDGDGNYIETIPKRGYRFVAEVREINEAETLSHSNIATLNDTGANPQVANSNRRTTTYVATFTGCLLIVVLMGFVYWSRRGENFTPKSVAVLPFKTIGADNKEDYLGLGMADALIIKLSRLEQLTVLPTSSVFRFTNRDRSVIEIGRELGVESVLDGTVQRDGDWVRVTAQLIRLSDGKTVWSGKFDERYNSIFTLQDSISDQLSASLRPRMSGTTQTPQLASAHPTANTEAYEAYLTGLYFWNRRSRENLPKAITYLEQAVQKDPNFAEAQAILADCHYLSFQEEYGTTPRDEALLRADASATLALQLDENLAEAHTVKAGLKVARRDFDEAGRDFQRALELKPNYAVAHVRYAYFLFFNMRVNDAVYHMRQAQKLDPVSTVTNAALGGMLYNARDFDNSIAYSKRALELEPSSVAARVNLGEAYVQKRMFKEAHETFDQLKDTSPRYFAWEKAFAYAHEGRRDEAQRMLAEADKLSPRRIHFNYALVYGAMGEMDLAFAELEKAMLSRPMAAAIRFDPQFDPLRGDPRFNDFLKQHGIER